MPIGQAHCWSMGGQWADAAVAGAGANNAIARFMPDARSVRATIPWLRPSSTDRSNSVGVMLTLALRLRKPGPLLFSASVRLRPHAIRARQGSPLPRQIRYVVR